MGKLSRIELDVVSNEVYSKVVNEVNDKCLKIINENVDFSLLEELREIELVIIVQENLVIKKIKVYLILQEVLIIIVKEILKKN